MKRSAIAFTIVFLLVQTAAADIRGSWTASSEEPGKTHLSVVRDGSHTSRNWDVSSFAGLTDSQIHASSQTPVQFVLQREAGVITFEGTFRDGYGGGQFSFAPDRSYFESLRALGVVSRKERSDPEETQLQLALHDVSTAFIRSMQAEGYRVSVDEYLAMRIFRVSPELIGELGELGYTKISADHLVSMRIHKVTPEFIRELRQAGYINVPIDKLISMRIHGIDAKMIRKLNDVY